MTITYKHDIISKNGGQKMAKKKIKETINEFFESMDKNVEVGFKANDVLNENSWIYLLDGYNHFGFADKKGYAITPPIFIKGINLGNGLVLVESNYNYNNIDDCKIEQFKCGIFDTNENKMLVGCVYDHADIIKAGANNEYVAYVDLYNGANSYTIDMLDKKKEAKLNRHLSEYTLKVLERKPELFMKLDSAYFVDDAGYWNKVAFDKIMNSVNSGKRRILENMSKGGEPAKNINKFRISINKAINNKIESEKSKAKFSDKEVKLK